MPSVILATAHPAKFPKVFEDAGMSRPTSPVLEELLDRAPNKFHLDVDALSVRSFIEKKLKRT